jgi:hypothetical protein
MKISIVCVAVFMLFMAIRPAAAQEEERWWPDCRHGWIHKQMDVEDVEYYPPGTTAAEMAQAQHPSIVIIRRHDDTTIVRITWDELRKLLKDLPGILILFKACDAYRKCLDDREAGKVKHCYRNDRRWREHFHDAW